MDDVKLKLDCPSWLLACNVDNGPVIPIPTRPTGVDPLAEATVPPGTYKVCAEEFKHCIIKTKMKTTEVSFMILSLFYFISIY
jgi:hypothetical protein